VGALMGLIVLWLHRVSLGRREVWIELGSGDRPARGYLHCDVRPRRHVECAADVGAGLPFRSGVADRILACHILEHFSWRRTSNVLSEWARVLRTGGQLELITPNLRWTCTKYATDDYSKYTRYHIQSDIFGAQDYPKNYHHAGFDWAFLSKLLAGLGFDPVIDLSASGGKHDMSRRLHVVATKTDACRRLG